MSGSNGNGNGNGVRARPATDERPEIMGPADIASWQSRLRTVVLDTIDEATVRDILKAIIDKARAGDLQAARMILNYSVGGPAREERPDGPSRARPGTKRKLDALANRYVNGVELHHPKDARFADDDE